MAATSVASFLNAADCSLLFRIAGLFAMPSITREDFQRQTVHFCRQSVLEAGPPKIRSRLSLAGKTGGGV
jgi:hypothetical protein